ncbi:MAG: DNA repair exonuclease [Pyrinomonadaceae bacterium]|nr:DNA repair exonuclease [Pyrinomonadaceae bacterium]
MKFLHIADVHLGCTRYHLEESQRDFFDAWIDVLQKYAIDEKVDFVIMCGDFFHKRTVPPETMNYAFAGLSLLRDKGIPVVSIEGNHDQKHTDSEYSWLRSLANWNLLYLLEPYKKEGKLSYRPWDAETNEGGFIDIGNARIFGSDWYGASANQAIPGLIESVTENQRNGAFHILMLHTDVEGHQTHPIPALTVENLKKLKAVTQYVGLGHTHKCYEIDNWAFNPGSLEVTSISEYEEVRGAWLVEVDDELNVDAKHVKDYVQRPFFRMSIDVTPFSEPKEITERILKQVEEHSAEARKSDDVPKKIVEITLRGHLGFPNSSLELDKIRKEARKTADALHIRVKNHSVPIEYGQVEQTGESREELERRVIERSVAQDKRFRKNLTGVTDAVIGSKRMALTDESPEKIADFISAKLDGEEEAA